MSLLAAPRFARRAPRRAALDGRGIAGRRLGRVARVLPEALLEVVESPLEGRHPRLVALDQGPEGRLHSGRDLAPEFLGDRWLLPHAAGVGLTTGSVNIGS